MRSSSDIIKTQLRNTQKGARLKKPSQEAVTLRPPETLAARNLLNGSKQQFHLCSEHFRTYLKTHIGLMIAPGLSIDTVRIPPVVVEVRHLV